MELKTSLELEFEEIIKKLKYPPQICSGCNLYIFEDDDRLLLSQDQLKIFGCYCNPGGDYYFQSNIKTHSSGHNPNDESDLGFYNYNITKLDQADN